MTPEIKFHSFVTSTTTLIVFSVWSILLQKVASYPFVSVIIAVVFSLGIYRLVNTLFLAIFRKNRKVKKFILGPSYMEGTWVGFFVGHNKNIRYLVETFEQDLSILKVRGRVYRNDFIYHGAHISTDATINTLNGKLMYSYDSDSILNTHINVGLARFDLVRTSREEPAHHIFGYSSDLFKPNKLIAFEDKISDSTSVDLRDALAAAEVVYNKYRCVSGEEQEEQRVQE